jgi:hypothetical protein
MWGRPMRGPDGDAVRARLLPRVYHGDRRAQVAVPRVRYADVAVLSFPFEFRGVRVSGL